MKCYGCEGKGKTGFTYGGLVSQRKCEECNGTGNSKGGRG